MKKFLKKMIIWILICLAITVFPFYLLDPYNVLHWRHIRANGVEPNKNYIKTKYLLENPDKFDALLFGSSHVSAIHVDKVEEMRLYNMTYSSGTPQENYETLKTLLAGGVSVRKVYLGVDSLSYTTNVLEHYSKGQKCPYQYLTDISHFISLYCNPAMLLQSVSVIKKGGDFDVDAFYEYGWGIDYDRMSSFDWSSASPAIGYGCYMDEALDSIRAIRDLCRENGITLVVFTNPMHELTLRAVVAADYCLFLHRLAEITEFYNFSAINCVTCDTDYFLDASHYKASVGDMLIDSIFYGSVDPNLYSTGFGWVVTEDNVGALVEMLTRDCFLPST